LVLIGSTFFLREGQLSSRVVLALAWVLAGVFVPLSRRMMRGYCSLQTWWGVPTVVIGEEHAGVMMVDLLKGHARLGLKPVALLTDGSPHVTSTNLFRADISHARRLADVYPGCYAVIAMPTAGSDRLRAVLSEHLDTYGNVFIIPDLFGMRSLSVTARDMCGVLTLKLHQKLSCVAPRLLKRSFDAIVAFTALMLTAPIWLPICLLVKLSSKGPIFYSQSRIGQKGDPFRVWKFRTMVSNADEVLQSHLASDPALREEWIRDQKLKNDPRVTAIGNLLRRSSLDELPQLWNVLRGDMSLVGPRPIVSSEIEKYGDSFQQYQLVSPGLTGLWQISGRNNTTYDLRIRMDDYYVRNWSLPMDIYILLRTVKTILLSEGAY
jgi:Undecaprenyl-phosphate galactose phosphotransferase WbaP